MIIYYWNYGRHCGKGENPCDQTFSSGYITFLKTIPVFMTFFHHVFYSNRKLFSTLGKTEGNISFSGIFLLLSANAFNLDKAKFLSSGKGPRIINVYHMTVCWDHLVNLHPTPLALLNLYSIKLHLPEKIRTTNLNCP